MTRTPLATPPLTSDYNLFDLADRVRQRQHDSDPLTTLPDDLRLDLRDPFIYDNNEHDTTPSTLHSWEQVTTPLNTTTSQTMTQPAPTDDQSPIIPVTPPTPPRPKDDHDDHDYDPRLQQLSLLIPPTPNTSAPTNAPPDFPPEQPTTTPPATPPDITPPSTTSPQRTPNNYIYHNNLSFKNFHIVKGTEHYGILIDPGAAKGLIGIDTLKDIFEHVLKPNGMMKHVHWTTSKNRFTGISATPQYSLGSCTFPIGLKGFQRSTFTCDVLGGDSSKCPGLIPLHSLNHAGCLLACGYFHNNDGLLGIRAPNGTYHPQRLLLTDSGHYLLEIHHFNQPSDPKLTTLLKTELKQVNQRLHQRSNKDQVSLVVGLLATDQDDHDHDDNGDDDHDHDDHYEATTTNSTNITRPPGLDQPHNNQDFR
jgi:hypothetical protein